MERPEKHEQEITRAAECWLAVEGYRADLVWVAGCYNFDSDPTAEGHMADYLICYLKHAPNTEFGRLAIRRRLARRYIAQATAQVEAREDAVLHRQSYVRAAESIRRIHTEGRAP